MTQIKNRHPEQKEDEIFLGNACHADAQKSYWKSSRFGNVAYQLDGKVIPYSESKDYFGVSFDRLRPWFIKKSEVERRIQSLPEERGIYSEAATLQRLLNEAKGGVKLPRRLFQNENVRFIFQDENGKTIMDDPNLFWDGVSTEYPSGKETYSFRPIDSGKFTFWPTNYEIISVD